MRSAFAVLFLAFFFGGFPGVARADESRSNLTREFRLLPSGVFRQSGFRRDEFDPLALQGFRRESGAVSGLRSRRCPCEGDVSLDGVALTLNDDFDHDGFFQFVRLDFSLRTRLPRADVFVQVFLSFEGGPWNRFAATRRLTLSAAAPLSYAIESRLRSGYPSGYYDVLIEVFDADSGRWLLSHGPYEDWRLQAAPLESANRDDFGAASFVGYAIYGTGGMSPWWLLVVLALSGFRAEKRSRSLANRTGPR